MKTTNKDMQRYAIDIQDFFVSSSSDESDNINFSNNSILNINHNNDIKIENIAGEQSLIEYTQHQYETQLKHNDSDDFSIFKYNEHYFCSDSPITMSNNNSDDDEEKEDYRSLFANIDIDSMNNDMTRK